MYRSIGVFFAFTALVSYAQVTTGSILGRVSDSTGAIVREAAVVVSNINTGLSWEARTNEFGEFSMSALPVGAYRITVSHPGFKRFVQEGIVVEVNRAARVDIRLDLGAVSDTVTVSSDAPLVETTQSSVSQVVEGRRITELPLSGRNTVELVRLTPGVTSLGTGSTLGYTEYRVTANGASSAQVQMLLDGGSNTSTFRNTGMSLPNPDAVQEFRVIFSNMSAEYGRLGLGVINTITRSGTNQLHGSLFEFLRNRAITARSWNTPKVNPLVQNQFGGSAGGPILRDRAFFFFSYQQLERREALFRNTAVPPTALERAGDFSRSAVKPVMPGTTQPFPGNVIPLSSFDPVSRTVLDKYIPAATTPDGRFEIQAPFPTAEKQVLVKIDDSLTSLQRLSFNYFRTSSFQNESILGDVPYASREFDGLQQNVGVAHTWNIRPNWLNAFRLGFTRSAGQRLSKPELSLADLGSHFTRDSTRFLPNLAIAGYVNMSSSFIGPTYSNQYQLTNATSYTRGRHSIKFGGEAIDIRDTQKTALYSNGNFTFSGSITGNAMADFLLGRAARFDVSNQFLTYRNYRYFSGFIQDDVRVSHRLTLNLGLRWEVSTPVIQPHDLTNTFRLGFQSQVVPKAPPGLAFIGDPGVSRGLYDIDWNNFAPRFGFALDVFGDGKTALRGGYGIYYTEMTTNQQGGDTNEPFAVITSFFDVPLKDPWAKAARPLLPFIFDPKNPFFTYPMTVALTDPTLRTPYIQQFNLSVQRQVGAKVAVEVGYLGNLGRKLVPQTQVNWNEPVFIPGQSTPTNIQQRRPILPDIYSDILANMNQSRSSYNALQVSASKRYSSGLNFVANYVFSKAIDDDAQPVVATRRDLEKGMGANDVRHNFVSSAIWEPVWTHSLSGVPKQLFDGWQLSGILSFRSGFPFTVTAGQDINLNGVNNDRPNLNGDPRLSPNRSRNDVSAAWFDTSKFTAPAIGALGTAGRNILIGPGYKNLDLGAIKNFRIHEGHKLQFRAEFFNTFNWVNLLQPVSNIRSATAGRILSADSPRVIQFGLKYLF